MELKTLTIADRGTFEAFLRKRPHGLSAYGFPAIYGWKSLFRIRWADVRGSLCVFFTDAVGTFLYLPPLGETPDARTVDECFREMVRLNAGSGVSRIENLEEGDLPAFRDFGYVPVFKSYDYVYSRAALAGLRGDAFKAKRALVNRFVKNNRFECLPYGPRHREACLSLYREWMVGKERGNSETVYRGMLADSLSCLTTLLDDPSGCGISGLVVTVNGAVKGFTLGYPLNDETLCVFFEITDLSLRGLSQFIFRRFCAENARFGLVNAMDDSGLANLEKVKMSYRPLRRVAAYIVNASDAQNRPE